MLDGGNAVFNLIMASMVLGTVLIWHMLAIPNRHVTNFRGISAYIYVCYSMENVDCVKYRIVITCQVWQGDGADRRLHRIVQPGHRRCHRRDIKISGTELQKAKDQKNFTQKTHLICNISNFATKCVNGPQMKIIQETHLQRWRLHWKIVKYIFVCFIQSNRNPNL